MPAASKRRVGPKRKSTQPFVSFRRNIDRCQRLIAVAEKSHSGRKGPPNTDESDFLYSAIVFAVGALDAFVHDTLLDIVLLPNGSTPPKAALDALASALAAAPEAFTQFLRARSDAERRRVLDVDIIPTVRQTTGSVKQINTRCQQMNLGIKAYSVSDRINEFAQIRHSLVHTGRYSQDARGLEATAKACVARAEDIANEIHKAVLRKYYP